MTSLLELQRSFRGALLVGDGADTIPEIADGPIGAAARIGIYRNNVMANLTRALRLSYPAVGRLVGDYFFDAAAQGFIAAAPPRCADLSRYGEGFAAFLASFDPAAGVPYLADVARLEWAVGAAFNAPARSPLSPETLAMVEPGLQPDLRFRPQPSLSLLALDYPAHAIWKAVLADDDDRDAYLGAIDLEAGGETLAVLRTDGALAVEPLSGPAFELARLLAGGCPLGEALQCVPADSAVPLLAEILALGFFAGVSACGDGNGVSQG